MKGFTDNPINKLGEDIFQVGQYISGLTEFILECNTPMTIAIQGDWGSGKTSMMNMIREKLGDSIETSWFNTWQYSQFNMGDNLAISFLTRLISDLEIQHSEKNVKLKKALKVMSRLVKTASVVVVDSVIGGKAADAVENGVSESEDADLPAIINEMKTHFENAVDEKLKQSGKDRLVIFIDDLDRLNPGKAVELLEVLKLFLDCKKCVFVLAIDYAVVSQGVKQKYGDLLGEGKGKSFFDKIIQVPFKMPVAQYNVHNYVKASLESLGIVSSDDEIEAYVKLIQKSVGCNPRAMKRLFNAFLLLNKISVGTIENVYQKKILFAILCLQLSFESVYNYIVQNPDDCFDGNLLKSLANSETYTEGDDAQQLSNELKLNSDEIAKVVAFMSAFNMLLDEDKNGDLSETEIRAFIKILGFSTITANTATESNSENNAENEYRYYNRGIIKDTINPILEKCKIEFKPYQSRTNNNPNWRKQHAAGWAYIPSSFGKIGFEYKIATNLQNKESELSIWIYPADKTDRYRFVETLKPWCEKQTFGFVFLEKDCGFWLNGKTVNSDSRSEILQYFIELVPEIVNSFDEHI